MHISRIVRAALAVTAVALLSACTPEQMIRVVFVDDQDHAVDVATCESTLDPGAVSPGGGNHGLFQINTVHRADFESYTGQPWRDGIYDPWWNVVYAHHLYETSGGWGPWSCR